MFCWHLQTLPPHHKQYRNTTIEAAYIQECCRASLNTGNGRLLCGTCLGPLEYTFTRSRSRKYTAEDGPATETTSVSVGHCLEGGCYTTIYPDDTVRNKQYCIDDIRSVLERKADYSLASARTKSYWRSWFRGVWDAVVERIGRYIGRILSRTDICRALLAWCGKCGDEWLRYVLDLFSTGINHLCLFFDIIGATIGHGSGGLCDTHANEGWTIVHTRHLPPRGG